MKSMGKLERQERNVLIEISQCCPAEEMFIGDEFTSSTSSVCITLLKRSYTSPIEKSKEMPNTKLRAHFCFICREFKTCIGRHLQKVIKCSQKINSTIIL